MTTARSLNGRVGVLLAAFFLVGMTAASTVERASAEGRALVGDFCSANHFRCMTLTWDGVAYGTPNRTDLSLRPGTYWLTVNDTSSMHDFVLRSCPDSTSPCDQSSGGTANEITTPMFTGTVTEKVLLDHGTYRLFCNVDGHEAQGMFVDFEVGGVGQVG
jgi:uncharacterized cupredoxin-like copper-binding protein